MKFSLYNGLSSKLLPSHHRLRAIYFPIAVLLAFIFFVQTGVAEERSSLDIEIFVSTPDEINTTSVLIMGDTQMMVVCAQGTRSAATRLANQIEATGLELKYIFLTHAHLDHSQGAGILLERFPNARFVTTPEIGRLQRHRMPVDDAIAKARFGDNAAIPSVPVEDITADSLTIDGQVVEIWHDIVGDAGLGHDTEPHVALYVPSANALIPSDAVYFNAFVMTGGSSPVSRAAWIAQIDAWIEKDFSMVVPGHVAQKDIGNLTPAGALEHTRRYLADYDRVLAQAQSSKEVIATMLKLYPDAQHQTALYLSAFIDFKEMRNLSFNPKDREFEPGLTSKEIEEIDRRRFEGFRALVNPPAK